MKELVGAASYLHNNGIVHRDIKMENVLLLKDDSVINERKFTTKLTDFGLSTVKTGASFQDMIRDRCGTLAYMAPEIIIKRSYSQQCDVWAIGVLLFALISGEFPFARSTNDDIRLAIISQDPNLDAIRLKSPNKDRFVHLIQGLLHKDPAYRTTAIEILDHPWILEQPLHDLKSCNVLEMMAQCVGSMNWIDSQTKPSFEKNLLTRASVKSVASVQKSHKSLRPSSKTYNNLTKSLQKPKCVGSSNEQKRTSKEIKSWKVLEIKGAGRQSMSRPRPGSYGMSGREQLDVKVTQNDGAIKQDYKKFKRTDRDNVPLSAIKKKMWR